jgi:putative phosphoesterase
MRIAVISDIHGNLVSLEAVLRVLDGEGVDDVVCLGDVAATGPQPREVVERLRSRGIPVIMGNADEWLINPSVVAGGDEDARRIVELNLWCRRQLTPTELEYIGGFPATREVVLGYGLKMLCCHGSPQSNMDRILSTTGISDLQRMLSGVEAEIVACGHTHIQMFRRYMNRVIVNPGSVGMPYDVTPGLPGLNPAGARMRNPPWAEYAIVSSAGQGLEINIRRTPINREAVIQAAFDSAMPNPDWWTRDWRLA